MESLEEAEVAYTCIRNGEKETQGINSGKGRGVPGMFGYLPTYGLPYHTTIYYTTILYLHTGYYLPIYLGTCQVWASILSS